MSEKIKLPLGIIGNGAFTSALGKLCGLTILSGKDAYALMRTLDLLEPELSAYQKALSGLLKKHGARSSLQPLRDAALVIEGGSATGLTPEQQQSLADLHKEIARLEPIERLEIGPGDAGWEAFQAERKELDARPVELFLNHKVSMPLARLPDGALNAFDMRELTSLVDFISDDHK